MKKYLNLEDFEQFKTFLGQNIDKKGYYGYLNDYEILEEKYNDNTINKEEYNELISYIKFYYDYVNELVEWF